MPSKILTDGFEFETFELHRAYEGRTFGRYNFLKQMPKGSHFHFRDPPPKHIRSSIAAMNGRLAEQGSGIHFGVFKVGEDDQKGAGIRVIRDDLPLRRRWPKKARKVIS